MHEVLLSSESAEHYTPSWLLDMCSGVLGGIDIDPCADPRKRTPARRHFTQEDDGLVQRWIGTVYMNPPYGTKIGPWVRRFFQQYKQGWMTAGIALVPSRTDTMWFQRLYDHQVCFIRGRLCFLNEDYEEQKRAPFPSALFYAGPRRDEFRRVFSSIGNVVSRDTKEVS